MMGKRREMEDPISADGGRASLFAPSNNTPIDWNNDGDTADHSVFSDVNGDGSCSVLHGFNDWEQTTVGGATQLTHIQTSPQCMAGNWQD